MAGNIEQNGFSGTPGEVRVRLVSLSDKLQVQRYHLRRAAIELEIPLSFGIGGPSINPADVESLSQRARQIKADMQVPWAHERIPEGCIDRESAARELNLTAGAFDRLAKRSSLPRTMLGGKSYVRQVDIERIRSEREDQKNNKPIVSGK